MSNNIGVDLVIFLYDNMGWILSQIKKYKFVEMRNYSPCLHEQRRLTLWQIPEISLY